MRVQLRKVFVEELEKLDGKFTKMGLLTAQAIQDSIEALIRGNESKAHDVINNDQFINTLQDEITQDCFRIIALQQPIADELRLIMAILSAASDLERMGDHAESIAKGSIAIADEERIPIIEDEVKAMAKKVRSMADAGVDAFVSRNLAKAKKIAAQDDEIDDAYKRIRPEIIREMKAVPEFIDAGVVYNSMISNLERIADYVTNICEELYFIEKARTVHLN